MNKILEISKEREWNFTRKWGANRSWSWTVTTTKFGGRCLFGVTWWRLKNFCFSKRGVYVKEREYLRKFVEGGRNLAPNCVSLVVVVLKKNFSFQFGCFERKKFYLALGERVGD